MVYLVFLFNYIMMIVPAILLARWLARRYEQSWELFGMGALTFILAQFFHIPFNWFVLQGAKWMPTDTAVLSNLIILALFLGFSAGVFEEVARYLTFRYWATKARTWGNGMMLGAGHGGIEAILLGGLGLINFVILGGINQGHFLSIVSPDEMPIVREVLDNMFSLPWYMIIMGAVERLFAVTAHLAFSLIIMQAVVRQQRRWVLYAILWHAILDFTAVFAGVTWGIYVTEALIGLFALLSAGIIWWLYAPEPEEPEPEPLPEITAVAQLDLEVTSDMLDRSRYS